MSSLSFHSLFPPSPFLVLISTHLLSNPTPPSHPSSQVIVLYGRVTSVDLGGQKVSMSWSVYAGTASADNSSLFTAGTYNLDADGTWYGYPDVPVGALVSLP